MYVIVLVMDDVGSSAFGGGAVILTCTNCRMAAMIASPDSANPPKIEIAKTWSTRARSSPNTVTVLTASVNWTGVMSWQFSGRTAAAAKAGRLHGPEIWTMYSPAWLPGNDQVRRLELVERRLVVGVRGEAGHHAAGADEGLVEREQDRQLEKDRRAPGGGVDPVLAVEGLGLLVDLGSVALVLALHLADERPSCISFCEEICRTNSGARTVRMMIVNRMIASAKPTTGSS